MGDVNHDRAPMTLEDLLNALGIHDPSISAAALMATVGRGVSATIVRGVPPPEATGALAAVHAAAIEQRPIASRIIGLSDVQDHDETMAAVAICHLIDTASSVVGMIDQATTQAGLKAVKVALVSALSLLDRKMVGCLARQAGSPLSGAAETIDGILVKRLADARAILEAEAEPAK